jgi:hypothetical protein
LIILNHNLIRPDLIRDSLSQLAVLAATAVKAAVARLLFIEIALAFDAKTHTRDSLAARCWNCGFAFLTVKQAFAFRQTASGQLNGIFHTRVYLILYSPVAGPSTSHELLLK